LKDEGVFSGFC